MKIERIALKGFLSHSSTDWNPDGARLAAVVGPNGAGKSSLLDGVLYALYDDARGRTDDLVQLGASEMAATVEFTYAGARYRVTRGRSTRAGGKSFLELHVADGDAWRPLTADSIRETQAAITELLRMDAATFETAAWLMQGRANAFAEATAAERKRILGTVLGLDVYARAEAHSRELVRDAESRFAARRDSATRLELLIAERPGVASELDQVRSELTMLEDQRAAVRAEREQSTAALVDLISELGAADAAVREVARLTALMTEQAERWKATERRKREATERKIHAEAALAQEPRVRDAETRVAALEADLAAARAEEQRCSQAHHAWELETRHHAEAAAAAEAARQRLTDLRDQVDDTIVCPECGATVPAGGAALHQRITEAEGSVADALAAVAPAPSAEPAKPDVDAWRISEQLTEAKALAAALTTIEEARGIRDQAINAIAAEEAEAASIEQAGKATRAQLDAARTDAAAGEALRERRRTIEQTIEQLNRAERDAEAAVTERRQATGRLEARLGQLDAAAKELEGIRKQLAGDEAEINLLRRLVIAFGVNGIPARIIESVLPELSARANELLAQLRPGMALEIRAQRARKSGAGVIEALDLVVRDDVGERPLAMFSGGERMSVSLALAVGLSRLVARRAGTAIRTLVIDEPDGLDADARRAFGQALKVLAHAGELERIVLVSHHEDLAEYGDAVYAVSKDDRGSIVEQVA